METKEQKIQKIKVKRGEYTKAREKKFKYLKHIGRSGDYYMRKRLSKLPISMMPKVRNVVGELKWYERIYVTIVLALKQTWRKIFSR